jgi:hypothetical protein
MAAVVSIQPFRPQFLAVPGNPTIPWRRWLDMFEDYLVAVGFPVPAADAAAAVVATVAQRKAALLRASLGTEGYRLYCTLTADTKEGYDVAVGRLAAHFGQPPGAIFARAQFSRCQQRTGETVVQFVAQLREMAGRCEFPADQFSDRVRDQFVAWVYSDKIRERLLQEPITRTLDEMVQLALTIERASSEAALTAGSSSEPSINQVSNSSDRKWRDRRASTSSASSCWNCGKEGHMARDRKCPARDKECLKCGKTGHFAKCCRSTEQASALTRQTQRGTSRSNSKRRRPWIRKDQKQTATNAVLDDNEVLDQEITVSNVLVATVLDPAQKGDFKRVWCKVDGHSLSLMLDLGSKVSIISRPFYEQFLASKFPLQPADRNLRAYGGGLILCTGCSVFPVQFDGQKFRFKFYICESGDSLMGVDIFDSLGGKVTFDPDSPAGVATVSSPSATSSVPLSTVSLSEFPVLLKSSGTLRGFVHKPRVDKSVKPVQRKFHHPPLAMRDPISRELDRLVKAGTIERIESSEWISNIVPAMKKDGSVRVCVNMSGPNQALVPECHPLPTMEELTAKVAGSTVFSKLDLLWGYTQLQLDPAVRHMTAFVTHEGVFQFKTVVFGMSTGPSAFQSVIKKILEGLDGATNILDDILVYGQGIADHDRKLRAVLSRLAQYNATVRVDKCLIGKAEVDFNGYRVSAAGCRPLQSNVEAILKMPAPSEKRQLVRFLCTTAYYLKFLPHFSDLCEPLRALLKAEVWNWSSACQTSFEEIKRRIASPPVLAHFDVTADTFISADASSVALGACLYQRKDGVERPIAFASRVLSPSERKYSASEREALAALWACEKWHFYVYGRPFFLVTDHQALSTLLTTGGSGHKPLRLHRWSSRLFRYSFKVIYRPGKDQFVPDCLSRAYNVDDSSSTSVLPEADCGWDDDTIADVRTIFGALGSSVVTWDSLEAETATDEALRKVHEFVTDGWPSSSRQIPPAMRVFYDRRHELSVAGRCVVRGLTTVVPCSLRQKVLELAHEGHPGIVRMKRLCRATVWWPGIDADIEKCVKDCEPCIVSGKSIHPVPGPLQPLPWPVGPWRRLSLDIAGEFVAAPHHQRFIIAAIDQYSKWPEAAVCGTVTSSAVIDFLSTLFERFGLIEELVTDNGVQFVSEEFQQFLRQHGIRHCKASLYAPQSNGAIERFNRVLKEGIKTNMAEGKSFITGLRQTLAAYRVTPHAVTGVSPASLMLTFPMRTPLSMLSRAVTSSLSSPVTSGSTGQSSLPASMSLSALSAAVSPSASSDPSVSSPSHLALSQLRKSVTFSQNNMARYHDNRYNVRVPLFKAGDSVRILLPRRAHKLAPTYSEPRVIERVSGNMVRLQNGQCWNVRRCILHRSVLKKKLNNSVLSSAPVTVSLESDNDNDILSYDLSVFPSSQTVLRRSSRIRKQRDFGPVVSH